MKHLFLLIAFVGSMMSASAQTDKYNQFMDANIKALDTARTVDQYKMLAASFERIANAEKTQWHPYYYAAYANIMSGYMMMTGNPMGGNASVLDPVADKAEQMIQKAEELGKENSETFLIRKMIASLRMMGDPMNRYMQYGPAAQEAMEKSKKLNPQNPRAVLLEGQDKFYTPEQYGGSKVEAKKLFETAMKLYADEKPVHPHDPVWGKAALQYFMSQIK